ncbi:MAG: hypothetical protein ACFCU1_00845 [Sumerlaeia bacterium]
MLENFQTTSIFMGLFLRKLEVEDFQKFAESLPWRLPEFDGEVQVNPQQQNLPPDAPRVRFTSKDGRLLLEVAPAKVHFRMMPGEVTKSEKGTNVQALPVSKAYTNFTPQATRIYTTLQEHFGATANRVGVVTDLIAPTPSSANQRMQKVLLGDSDLLGDRLQELTISALVRTTLSDGVSINRRVNIRPMRTGQEGNPDLILNANIDINTVADEPYDLGTDELAIFLSNTSLHLQNDVPILNEASLFS